MGNVTEEIREFIETHRSDEKARYDEGTIPTCYEIAGVKIEDIDKFAKKLAVRKPKFEDYPFDYHEEVLLAGITIAYTKLSPEKKLEQLEKLLPYIDNWSNCDIIAGRIKGMNDQKEFFINLLSSKRPFYIRFAIQWLTKFALRDDVRGIVNLINDNVKNTNTYVEAALAACYAEALLFDYDYMVDFIQKLERYVVRNRTLQRACDSARLVEEKRKEIRKLRSKILGINL